jgi:hypothetical protein
MFSKNIIKSEKGKVYYVAKEISARDHLRTSYVTNEDGTEFIAKRINLQKLNISPNTIQEFVKNGNLSSQIGHPNVLPVVDKILTARELTLITPFHDDDSLEEVILGNKNSFNEENTRRFMISFVEFYQRFNEMQATQPTLRNNFSLASMYLKGGEILMGGWESGDLGRYLETFVANHLSYKAPEFLLGEQTDLEAQDMWSLGVCLYAFLYAELPFEGLFAHELLENIEEHSGSSLQFDDKVHVSFKCKHILTRLLDKNPAKRMKFSELASNDYVCKDRSKSIQAIVDEDKTVHQFAKKQVSEKVKKTGGISRKFANSLQDRPINRLSYENYEEIKAKKPLETNLELVMNVADSLVLTNSSVLDFSLSNPHVEINEDQSGYNLFRENNIAEGLLPYLFEKNLIIFLMDTTKKVKDCEGIDHLSDVNLELLYAQILALRKAWIQNYYMTQVMKHQINIYHYDDFESVMNNESYKLLEQFFNELNASIRHLYCKLKEDCLKEFPNTKALISSVDSFDIERVTAEFDKVIKKLQDLYRRKKAELSEPEKIVFSQAIIYLIYNRNSATRFSFENFYVTQEWIHFCQFLNRKNYTEIEQQFI